MSHDIFRAIFTSLNFPPHIAVKSATAPCIGRVAPHQRRRLGRGCCGAAHKRPPFPPLELSGPFPPLEPPTESPAPVLMLKGRARRLAGLGPGSSPGAATDAARETEPRLRSLRVSACAATTASESPSSRTAHCAGSFQKSSFSTARMTFVS